VNPARARAGACPRAGHRPDPGARAEGRLAKSDEIDAASLAAFGAATAPRATPWPGDSIMEIRELEAARRALVAERAALKVRLGTARTALVCRQLKRRIAQSLPPARSGADRQIAELEAELDARIAADPALARRRRILTSVPGLGAGTARALIAGLGELGSIGARQIAAPGSSPGQDLAGVAPMNWDSGLMRGRRHSSPGQCPDLIRVSGVKGGRAPLRATLYPGSGPGGGYGSAERRSLQPCSQHLLPTPDPGRKARQAGPDRGDAKARHSRQHPRIGVRGRTDP